MGVYTEALLDDVGMDDANEMIEAYAFESMVPGVCKDTDCLAVTDVESDQDRGWCPVCNKTTIVSCLRLWGVI